MSVLQNLLQALSAPQFSGAKISTAQPSWEVSSTGQTVTIGGDVSIVNGTWGPQIAVRDDATSQTIYFAIAKDKDGNSLYDKDAKEYRIVFMKYVGKKADRDSCFKAEPIV